jgi:CheY-like chemotaxis protein
MKMENWKDKKILVAEDEIANYMLISVFLGSTGAKITRAENGKKAIELSTNEQFDAILMDIKMPVMDGFEATKEIRKLNDKIPVIAQTAYAYKREDCIAGGFTDYISKPFTKDNLIQLLKNHFNSQG